MDINLLLIEDDGHYNMLRTMALVNQNQKYE
jgi:hypothetical protein